MLVIYLDRPYVVEIDREVAETTIKAQSINWFQAVEIKSDQQHLCFQLLLLKRAEICRYFFVEGYFFLRH